MEGLSYSLENVEITNSAHDDEKMLQMDSCDEEMQNVFDSNDSSCSMDSMHDNEFTNRPNISLKKMRKESIKRVSNHEKLNKLKWIHLIGKFRVVNGRQKKSAKRICVKKTSSI